MNRRTKRTRDLMAHYTGHRREWEHCVSSPRLSDTAADDAYERMVDAACALADHMVNEYQFGTHRENLVCIEPTTRSVVT
jgi:hypothetical protein